MTVAELWRYPVKSMAGERLPACAVGPAGIPGDRAWALVERATGKALSAKRHARLMLCSAAFVDEPTATAVPPAVMTLPDGAAVRTDDAKAASVLSKYLGVDCAPALAPGRHFDDRPLHLVSTATLRAFSARSGLDFDRRRFRPNILIEAPGAGMPDPSWVGKTLRVGAVDVAVAKDTKRCVMTTLPQPGLGEERGHLTTVVESGAILGVYGAALAEGVLRAGLSLRIVAQSL